MGIIYTACKDVTLVTSLQCGNYSCTAVMLVQHFNKCIVKDNFRSKVSIFSGTPFSASLNLFIIQIQTEITSYQDLKDLIDEQISVETQEKMISQAKEGLKNFIRGSQNFCKNGCVAKSADFFEV